MKSTIEAGRAIINIIGTVFEIPGADMAVQQIDRVAIEFRINIFADEAIGLERHCGWSLLQAVVVNGNAFRSAGEWGMET